MDFILSTVWRDDYRSILKEYGYKLRKDGFNIRKVNGRAVITIKSLEDMMLLKEKIGIELIIRKATIDLHINESKTISEQIEIYDGYRE